MTAFSSQNGRTAVAISEHTTTWFTYHTIIIHLITWTSFGKTKPQPRGATEM